MKFRVISDEHSDHGLPVGTIVEQLDASDAPGWSDEGVKWYTQGGEGDEVAIDSMDLEPVHRVSKTTITFTVLHRTDDTSIQDFLSNYDGPFDTPLGHAMVQAWDGDMVGIESAPVTEEVPDGQAVEELVAMGNDGTFFDDDDYVFGCSACAKAGRTPDPNFHDSQNCWQG